MAYQDLDAFQVDCSRRDEQIRMLLSQISTDDDRVLGWWTNYMLPWERYSQEDDYRLRAQIAHRAINWQIRQNLYHIKQFCG